MNVERASAQTPLYQGKTLAVVVGAAPGGPADRVKILREAYARALKDSDLLAEVERQRLDMEPSSGEEIQALHRDLLD